MYVRRLTRDKPRLGYLLDLEYNGERGAATLIFLDPANQRIFRWHDNTGHMSYLLTDASPEEVDGVLGGQRDYIGRDEVEKYNAIRDETQKLRVVLATNPLAIGGEPTKARKNNFRNLLSDAGYDVWEAWIRYVNNYCYDREIEVGMPYFVTKEKLRAHRDRDAIERRRTVLWRILKNVDYTDALDHWIRVFEEPLPEIKIASIDIEILPEGPNSIPNPIIANQPVITVSMVTSDEKKLVLMLKRPGVSMGEGGIPGTVIFFDTEKELILETFRIMNEYPLIVTFNGDNFDLMYLYNRAPKVGIPRRRVPIYVVRKQCKLRHGFHIDLYPFFKNPSIQNYAFKGKYKEFTLDAISKALLGRGKIEVEKYMEWLSYVELGTYCLVDAELTYDLLTFNDNVTLHLILLLVRMSNLTIYQLTRQRISDWVRSTFYNISRKRNWLIPNIDELKSKGEIQTKAKIKGKKYEGAIVRDPKSGIFFNVVVVDCASLYPSEVKERNIGFGTINCVKGEEWSKIPLLAKKLIWVMLQLCDEYDNPWYQEERTKLMTNIERDVENHIESGEIKTENMQENTLENVIDGLWTILQKGEKNIEGSALKPLENGIIKLELIQRDGKKTKNIRSNIIEVIKILNGMSIEDGQRLLGLNFSNLGEASAKSVGLVIQGLLNYIINMVIKDLEIDEITLAPWLTKTGGNFNFFVRTVIELSTTSVHRECKENKVPFTNHHICTKRRAIEADVIGGLRDARVFYYKPQAKNKRNPLHVLYSVLEQAIKVYINASYGVFGSTKFALYCPPVAETVTAFGRRDLTAIVERALQIGAEPIYGDTDSVHLNNPTPEQTAELQRWTSDHLSLDLGIDKVYRYAIFSHRKKNYLGVFEDNTVDIKGLTGKKRHIPLIIKNPFFEVMDILKEVTNEEEYFEARKRVGEKVLGTYRSIKDRNWENIKELAFRTQMSMNIDQYKVNSQHVKAARMMAEMGYPVKGGDIIEYIKANTKEGVMPLVDADPELVNIDAYLGQLESVFRQILEPMGVDFKIVRTEGGELVSETTLDMFDPRAEVDLLQFLPRYEDYQKEKV